MNDEPGSENAGGEKIERGVADKIDKKLDELGVGKSPSGKDQRDEPDAEGSASSSKNSDES